MGRRLARLNGDVLNGEAAAGEGTLGVVERGRTGGAGIVEGVGREGTG